VSESFRRAEEKRKREREEARAEARREEARQKALEEERERRREEEREAERTAARRAEAREEERAREAAERKALDRRARRREQARAERRREARDQARAEAAAEAARTERLQDRRAEAQGEERRQQRVSAAAEADRQERRRQAGEDERQSARQRQRQEARTGERRAEEADRQRADERAQQRRSDEAAEQRADSRAEQRRADTADQRRGERATQQRAADRTARRQAEAADERRAAVRQADAAGRRQAARRSERRADRRRTATPARPRSGPRLPTGEHSANLPWLSVDNGVLADESGTPVMLRGIAVRGLENPPAGATTVASPLGPADLETMVAWELTAVTVGIAADLTIDGDAHLTPERYLSALDRCVGDAAEAGLYTIVQLAQVASRLPSAPAEADGEERHDPALPDPAAVEAWGVLARRYQAEPAVLFQVFRSPHDPDPGDPLGQLLPRLDWRRWREWLLAMVGTIRREHPRALIICPGLARGTDLSGFPLRRSDGSEPANLVYAAEIGAEATGDPLGGLERLGRDHAVGAFGWRADAEELRAVETLGTRLARVGCHWIADSWRGGDTPLVLEREGRLTATPLGRAFRAAAAQPAPPITNIDPALRRARPGSAVAANQLVPGGLAAGRTPRPARRKKPRRRAAITGARILRPNGSPFAGLTVRLVAPGGPHAGTPVTTDATGLVRVPNPAAGTWLVVSAEYELVPRPAATQDYAPVEVEVAAAPPPDATYDVPILRGSVVELVARPAFYLVCPQCGRTFKTVEPAAGAPARPARTTTSTSRRSRPR
jgi:hypothetical protein